MFCIFRILHIQIPRVFFSPSWNCSVENHTFLKVWLQLLLHSPAVHNIFIHLSLYLSFPQPFKPSDWYFQLWSQTAKWTLSLTEIEKARCFSHGKLKPSWIPGLTCNDPNHSRHPVGQYTCCSDYLKFHLGWKKTWMHAQQCQITSPAMINNNKKKKKKKKKKQQTWIGSLFKS